MGRDGQTQRPELTERAILGGLSTQWLGRRVVCYGRIGSTQAVATSLAAEGAAEGTLVIADEQTAGRGRLDRRWLAPAGTCLLLSLLFRPRLEARRVHGLTMACGLGIREAIHTWTGLPVQLKWPNDVMLRGRKLGGILTEASTSGEHLDWAVVGIGLNVNVPVAALPTAFQATSIHNELGRSISRVRLLQKMLLSIEQRYLQLQEGQWPRDEWAAALETLGRHVQLNTVTGAVQGYAEAVNEEGALLLRLDDGHLLTLWVGDIVTTRP